MMKQNRRRVQRGAQTLEWLALALLVLAILGGAASLAKDTSFGKTLQEKFMGMVNKIDSGASGN